MHSGRNANTSFALCVVIMGLVCHWSSESGFGQEIDIFELDFSSNGAHEEYSYRSEFVGSLKDKSTLLLGLLDDRVVWPLPQVREKTRVKEVFYGEICARRPDDAKRLGIGGFRVDDNVDQRDAKVKKLLVFLLQEKTEITLEEACVFHQVLLDVLCGRPVVVRYLGVLSGNEPAKNFTWAILSSEDMHLVAELQLTASGKPRLKDSFSARTKAGHELLLSANSSQGEASAVVLGSNTLRSWLDETLLPKFESDLDSTIKK